MIGKIVLLILLAVVVIVASYADLGVTILKGIFCLLVLYVVVLTIITLAIKGFLNGKQKRINVCVGN